MPIDILTPNRGYKEPHPTNPLSVDVARLIDQVRQIDTDMANVLAGLAGKADINALAGYILATARGQANGVAELDGTAKVPEARLPSSVLGRMVLMGNWDALTNTPALPTPAAAYAGHTYRVTVAGSTSQSGITDWKVGDQIACGTDGVGGYIWIKTDNTDQVTNVAGLQGSIAASALGAALAGLVSEASVILLGGVALSGGSFIINNSTITRPFKRFRIILDGASHNSGSNQSLQIALSGNNGSTWSTDTDFSAPLSAAAPQGASLEVLNCNVASGTRTVTSASVGAAQPTPYISTHSVTTGYVNAIRLKPSPASWDAGTITVIGCE